MVSPIRPGYDTLSAVVRGVASPNRIRTPTPYFPDRFAIRCLERCESAGLERKFLEKRNQA